MGHNMLMITIEQESRMVTLRFAGRLAGPEARALARDWPTATFKPPHRQFMLDLTGVTSIDAVGEAFLERVQGEGARVVGMAAELSGANHDRLSRIAGGVFSP
jgi:hypothetical protein